MVAIGFVNRSYFLEKETLSNAITWIVFQIVLLNWSGLDSLLTHDSSENMDVLAKPKRIDIFACKSASRDFPSEPMRFVGVITFKCRI